MFKWLKRMLSGYDPAEEIQEQEIHYQNSPQGMLWATIATNTCPDCGSKKGFYEGPSGGLSTNIQCIECGQAYNVTPMIGIAERI